MEALVAVYEDNVRFRRRVFMVIVVIALLIIMIFVIPASGVANDTKLLAEAAGGVAVGVVGTKLLSPSKRR